MYCLIGGCVDVNVNLCLLVVNHVCQSVCCLSSKCRCLTVVDVVTNDDIFFELDACIIFIACKMQILWQYSMSIANKAR